MSQHRAASDDPGRHRRPDARRASRLSTLWRLLRGASPLRNPCVPAAAMLAQLATSPHPARGVVRTHPRTQEAVTV